MKNVVINNIKEITSLHEQNWENARGAFQNALRIGELLVAEKERCGHDNWLAFVRDNLPFDERSARNYMRLYRNKEKVLKSENVSDLILSKAYALLRKPRGIKDDDELQNASAPETDEPKVFDVDAQVIHTDGEPNGSSDPLNAPISAPEPPSHGDAGKAVPAAPESGAQEADGQPAPPAKGEIPREEPLQDAQRNGEAIAKPGAPALAVATERLAPSSLPQGQPAPPDHPGAPVMNRGEAERQAVPVAAVGTTSAGALGGSKEVKFILADDTNFATAWIESRALPAEKIHALLEMVKRHNADQSKTYGYDLPNLVKFQHRIIAEAVTAMDQLGSSPAAIDVEMVRNAKTEVRDILPNR